MKRKAVYIIHGWDGSPEEPMHKWIKTKLEEKKYKVVVPKMPNPEEPKIKPWIEKINQVAKNLNNEDILIGHSIGCQAILRYLGTLKDNQSVAKVVLIAPWMYLDEKTAEEEGEESRRIAKPWVETPIDWEKIKNKSKEFVAIFSDNDPYVPLANADLFRKNLNAKILILNKRGHFDPSSGINELPEILEYVR